MLRFAESRAGDRPIINLSQIDLSEDISYEEQPVQILDQLVQNLRGKSIPKVLVKWQLHDDTNSLGNGKTICEIGFRIYSSQVSDERGCTLSRISTWDQGSGLCEKEVRLLERFGEEEKCEYLENIATYMGLRFVTGRDGGMYIDAIAPEGNADKTGMFTVGDKVIATSAVFGTEIWPAAEYGRTMYTIRQRIGPLLMKMEKRYGKMEKTGELTEKEIIRAERNSGVISNRVREIQMQNYLRKVEQKECREKDLQDGLKLYKEGKYEEALERFESVLGSTPDATEASVASYNVACCYSKLNQVQAGLSALEDALKVGFEDFKRIRTDPDLSNLRTSEEFEPLVKRFDESFINENAINAIKSLFGFNKK
ncbi:hypothetical protein Syun_031614 [Stephania yunnanensis]|uniref:PDZ domain-containing protein n=1 Tax=Stephania yunnanensis TaxID=152371 RepID=A0AAP0E3B9_9MAGN